MKTMTDPRTMQQEADALRRAGRRLAVVPTMGALHEGHLALIREARLRADVVIVTIFVNPIQFGEGEDYARYPRDPAGDASKVQAAGADLLFVPVAAEMFGSDFQTHVSVGKIGLPLEGASRPAHFRGVATVVAKLFHITRPHVAVFGQKDAQQVAVIGRMIQDLDFDIELVVVPTVREADGLAMSSRNAYLTEVQRSEARVLHASLRSAAERIRSGDRSAPAIVGAMREMITSRSSGLIDYVSIADSATLHELVSLVSGQRVLISLAVKFGTTRLIDNIHVTV
jgi:pantoate--beta-alanine ligase